MDRQSDTQTDKNEQMIYADRLNVQTERHSVTQIDGQTVGRTDRWTDRQADRCLVTQRTMSSLQRKQ